MGATWGRSRVVGVDESRCKVLLTNWLGPQWMLSTEGSVQAHSGTAWSGAALRLQDEGNEHSGLQRGGLCLGLWEYCLADRLAGSSVDAVHKRQHAAGPQAGRRLEGVCD